METPLPRLRKNHSFQWEYLEKARTGLLIGIPVLLLLVQAGIHIGRGYAADEVSV